MKNIVKNAIKNLSDYYPLLENEKWVSFIQERAEFFYKDTGNDQADYERVRDFVERLTVKVTELCLGRS